MMLSFLTVCGNGSTTIEEVLRPTVGQEHPEVGHIVIDAKPIDDTMAIAECHRAPRARSAS